MPGMLADSLEIINKLGLHARAAAKLAGVAARFSSDIKIGHGDKLINAKSVMALMMLAAGKGTELNITVEGEDETEALSAIQALVADRFEEAE